MFSIAFDGDPNKLKPRKLLAGRIIAGDLSEKFQSVVGYWSADVYRRQWESAIDSIIAGAPMTALITSMEKKPTPSGALDWWPIFRVGHTVYIRNQLLIFSQLERVFDPCKLDEFIGLRTEFDEDGYRISEWSCSLDDLVEFRRQHV